MTVLLAAYFGQHAPQHFEDRLAVAERQSAKLWELRASMDLARLWDDQGKRTEARNLLAPVYGWFTEGFDTRDLKEAKALLDELSS
jgi:predicted ATPase